MNDQHLDLDPIEAREKAATPGPWTVSEDYSDVLAPDGSQLASYWNPTSETQNGEFIAHAREDVPALLAEVRRLRAEMAGERERYTAGLRRADEHVNAMSEELKRYADGEERPVLWSVYNAMHHRAATAEGRVAELETAMRQIRHLHKDSPMGPCPVCVDADAAVAGGDGLMPYPCPTGRLAGAQDCEPPHVRAAVRPVPAASEEQR